MTFIATQVNELQLELLRRAYPGIDVEAHLARMDSWLWANPRKRPKKNMARFIANWLDKHIPVERPASVTTGAAPISAGTISVGQCKVCKNQYSLRHLERNGGTCGSKKCGGRK